MNVTISEEALNYGSFAALGSIAGKSKQTADDDTIMAKNITINLTSKKTQ